MKIIPVRSQKLILTLDLVLGSVPLNTVALETPAHLRLQPNKKKQTRETVSEFQSRISKPGTLLKILYPENI